MEKNIDRLNIHIIIHAVKCSDYRMRYLNQTNTSVHLTEKKETSQVHWALAAPFHAAITHTQVLDTLVWLNALA